MWDKIGIEGDCVKFIDKDTGDVFMLDIGLYKTGEMKDPSKTVDALCKERLPKKEDKKYPVTISIARQNFITRYIYETSCDTFAELQATLTKIFQDQRECPSRSLSWYCECFKDLTPPDSDEYTVPVPMRSGIVI